MREHREHPLLMKGPLVRATLEGRKTQTRRPLRNQPPIGLGLVRVCGPWAEFENDVPPLKKFSTKGPLGQTGDRLWVRETWQHFQNVGQRAADFPEYQRFPANCFYRADESNPRTKPLSGKWRPSLLMPRWACRLVLPLVSVRVERVQDITEEDARAEGLRRTENGWTDGTTGYDVTSARAAFQELWASIYGQASWDVNPWVWVAEWEDIEVSR